MIKNGFGFTTKNKQTQKQKQTQKLPPWKPSGTTGGDFPPLPPTGPHKGPARDVKTDNQLITPPVKDIFPKPSTRC